MSKDDEVHTSIFQHKVSNELKVKFAFAASLTSSIYIPQIRWAVVFIQTFFILIKPADEDPAPTFTTKHLDNQPNSRIQVICQEQLMWP